MKLSDILNRYLNEDMDNVTKEKIEGMVKNLDLFLKMIANAGAKQRQTWSIDKLVDIKKKLEEILQRTDDTIGEEVSSEIYKPIRDKLKEIAEGIKSLLASFEHTTTKGIAQFSKGRLRTVKMELETIVDKMDSYGETIGE